MRLDWIVLISFALFSKSAFANLDSALEKTIYSTVYKHCSSSDANLEHSLAFVESMKGSFKAFNETVALNTNPVIQLYRDRGFSPTTSTILDSMGLHLALKACYGNDDTLKKQFVLKMIVADLLGRTVGTAQGIAVFVIGGRFFAFVVKRAYRLLLLTPFGKYLNPANIGLHLGVARGVVVAGLLTPHFLEIYNKKQAVDKSNTADLKEYEEILELAHTEITRILESQSSTCEKSQEAYEVALIIQDVYKTLKERSGAQKILKRFESLHQYSLQIKTCSP